MRGKKTKLYGIIDALIKSHSASNNGNFIQTMNFFPLFSQIVKTKAEYFDDRHLNNRMYH